MRTRNSDLLSLAPVSMLFLGINLALFVYCAMASKNIMTMNSDVLAGLGMSMRERVWEGEWARLILPSFLHGGLIHICLNAYMLYNYGPAAEVHFGHSNYASLYLLSGLGGIAFSQLCSGNPSIGASTSLFGIIGAELAITILNVPVLKNAWRSSLVRTELFRVAIYFAMGLSRMMGPVDNWGHLGGFVLGFLMGIFFEQWRRNRRIGMPLLAVVVASIALMVCAARWTIFSPYYHLHIAALADENDDPKTAEKEYAEAQSWAKVWSELPTIDMMIQTHKLHVWTAEDAHKYTYARLVPRIAYRQVQVLGE